MGATDRRRLGRWEAVTGLDKRVTMTALNAAARPPNLLRNGAMAQKYFDR